MLQANWDARRQDYIGLFVPFVVVCLPASTTKPIVWPDLIESVQQRFGMKIPSNTIRTIMNRAKDQRLVKVENGVWYCVDEGRTLQRLDSSRSQALRRQASLVDRLCRFCREHHDTDWGENEARDALLSYVKEDGATLLARITHGAHHHSVGAAVHQDIIIASFITHVEARDPIGFQELSEVVYGSTLLNVLLFPALGSVPKRFISTRLFFDTRLLLQVLGLLGSTFQAPIQELIQLISDLGGAPCVLEETVLELSGVLRGHITDLDNPSCRNGEGGLLLEEALRIGRRSSDVELIISDIEMRLRKVGLSIFATPERRVATGMFEQELSAYLQNDVKYRRPRALIHDVNALLAVYDLRNGNGVTLVEQAGAIFVTANERLAKAAGNFSRHRLRVPEDSIPPCLTDHLLSTLLWLKRPESAPNFPQAQLIADAYALLDPPEELWTAYVRQLEHLRADGQILEEQYLKLRHDRSARIELMGLTDGEPAALQEGSMGTALQVLKALERGEKARDQRTADDLKRQRDEYQQTLENIKIEHEQSLAIERERSAVLAQELADRDRNMRAAIHRKAEQQAGGVAAILYTLATILVLYFFVLSFRGGAVITRGFWIAAACAVGTVTNLASIQEGFSLGAARKLIKSWLLPRIEGRLLKNEGMAVLPHEVSALRMMGEISDESQSEANEHRAIGSAGKLASEPASSQHGYAKAQPVAASQEFDNQPPIDSPEI